MSFLAFSDPIQHVIAHELHDNPFPFYVDNHMIMQVLATVLLLILLVPAAAKYGRRKNESDIEGLVPRGRMNFFESICSYIRNEVAKPTLEQHTDRFIPYIWTVFFFILFCNLLGMVPVDAMIKMVTGKTLHIGGTATGNIIVTFTLAVCTMLMMVINGLRLGGMHYIAHFCPGPLWLAPLLVPVEILGLFAKVFALGMRLFCNMMAGHILLAVLIGFGTVGYLVAVPSLLGAMAISCLELFVAFLQAFIFTFLTCLFIGQSVVFHHDGHGHEHAEGAH
jgi:F-type H+-transporting ATPase subunit a